MKRSFRKAKSCTHVHELAEKIHVLVEEKPHHTDIHDHSQTIINSEDLVCSDEEKKTLATHTTKFEATLESIEANIEKKQLELKTITGTTASPETIAEAQAEIEADLAANGQPCTANADCQSGNCDTTATPSVCASAAPAVPAADGEACAADGDCQSGNCDLTANPAVCAAAPPAGGTANGQPCAADGDCQSGNCDLTANPSVCAATAGK